MPKKNREDDSSIVEIDLPCPLSDCASSDAFHIYDDGHGYCFSCDGYVPPDEIDGEEMGQAVHKKKEKMKSDKKVKDINDYKIIREIEKDYQCRGFKEREITKEIAEFYECKVAYDEAGEIDIHYYPYHDGNRLTGYKVRKLPKKFWAHGDIDNLFGQKQFGGGGKRLVITEGEMDAMAVQQASFDKYRRNYPAVSLPKGAASSEEDIIANMKWIQSFEEVILFYDQDEKGQNNAKIHSRLIGVDRCKIVTKAPENDASKILLEYGGMEVLRCIWDAEEWTPENIMNKEDLWKEVETYAAKESIPYPPCITQLNSKLKGRRLGEITTWISGTGAGKSTIVKELVLHTREVTEEPIGLIILEESPGETARKLCAVAMNRNLAEEDITAEEMRPTFDYLFKDDQIRILNHHESEGTMLQTMEHMAIMGCKYIVLDHITLLASETSDGRNENAHVDKIMNDMRRMVKQRDVHVDVISQLRKMGDAGKSFEDGVMPTLDDIKGSGSIKQCSFDVIGFARNLNAENDLERNTIHLASLKCRHSGLTGPVPDVYYSYKTSRIVREPPDEYGEPCEFDVKTDKNGDISQL